MMETFWDTLSKYVGIENAILIALNGYFLFLIVFYRRENNTVWKDFQGSDRILIGGLMGLVLHFLFIMPLSVYIDSILFLLPKYIRETYQIYEFAGLTTQFVSSIIVFAPLIFLRRKTYLFSQQGSEAIKTSILNYGKKFLYIYLITFTFQISAYISIRFFYTRYVLFNNFWIFIKCHVYSFSIFWIIYCFNYVSLF